MANTKVKQPLPTRKPRVRTDGPNRPERKIGQFEALESRQMLSAFQPVDVRFQTVGFNSLTQVQFDGAGNCLGATGAEAARHNDCLVGGGSTDPNRLVITFSGPINKKTFNAAADVSITGDAGSFGVTRGSVKSRTLTLFTTGNLPTDPDSDLTISLNGISGKRPTNVAMDPWSVTVDVTAGADDPNCTTNCTPDTTPPRVLNSLLSPSSNPQFFDVTFSEDVQANTVSGASVRLIGRGPDLAFNTADDRSIAGSIVYNASSDIARFTPVTTLTADTYQLRVGGSGTIRDLANNPFDQDGVGLNGDDFIIYFTVSGTNQTPDTTPPVVESVTPSLGTVLNVSPQEIVVTFSEDMDAASVTSQSNFLLLRSGGDSRFDNNNESGVLPLRITFDSNTRTAHFQISGTLENDTYEVLLLGTGAMRDRADNFLDGDRNGAAGGTFISTFQLQTVLETVPPRVILPIAIANQTITQPLNSIDVRFNEDLAVATITNGANFQVIGAGGDHSFNEGNEFSVTGRIDYDPVTDTARFVPGARMANDDYVVRLVGTNSIRDLSDNRLDGNGDGIAGDDLTFSFSLAVPLPPDTLPGPQKDVVIGGDPPDATGDTFGSATPKLDITSISAFHDTINLYVNVRFRAPVAPAGRTIEPPSSNEPNSVYGFIDVDADQDLSSGLSLDRTPAPISGTPGLGIDYFVDIGSEARHQNQVEVFYTGLKVPLAGDFDADGDDDFIIFRPLTGEFLIGENSAGQLGSVLGPFAFGAVQPAGAASGEQPLLGDWDPDGGGPRRSDSDQDIGTFDAATGVFKLDLDGNGIRGEDRNGNGQLDPSEDVNNNGTLDVGEDINNNGQLDPAEDVNGNGTLDSELFTFGFTVPSIGDQAVIGDWDGDGDSNIGVYRPSSGQFVLDLDGDYVADFPSEVAFTFGPASPTNVAIPGDWNFNGRTEVGVFVRGEDLNGNGLFDIGTEDLNGNLTFENTAGFFLLDRDGDRRQDPDEDRNGNGVLDVGEDTNDEDPSTLGAQGNGLLNNDGPFSFGLATDTPIRGAWASIGRDDIGVQRVVGTDSRFFLDLNNDRAISTNDGPFTFGTAGDVPLAGKYGLDGRSSVGVYRGTSLAGSRVGGDQFFIDTNVNRAISPGEGPFTVVPTTPIEFLASSFTVKLPLTLISNDEGFVNFAATVGPFAGFTDEAPNPGTGLAASGNVTPLQVTGLNFVSGDTIPLRSPLASTLPKSTIQIPAGPGTSQVDVGTVGLQVTVAGGDAALDSRLDPESIRADTVFLEASGGDDTFNDGNEVLIALKQIVIGTSVPVPSNQNDTIFLDLTGVVLKSDLYRLVLMGDDPVRDPNGIPLDGEFLDRNSNVVVTNPEDLPSGNGFPQGDFIATFRLDAPPEIISFRLTRPTDQNVDPAGLTPGDTGVIGDGTTNSVIPNFVGVVKDDRLPIIGDVPGDTFGSGQNQADIIEASAEFDVNNPCLPTDPSIGCLHVGLRFTQPVGLASSGAPISVRGFIDIDADQDSTTGGTGWIRDLNANRTEDFGEAIVNIGQQGDVPIVGKWSNAGSSRLGVYRPDTGEFLLDLNGDNTIGMGEGPFAGFTTNGVPVVADFNGDGDDEVGVFLDGNWRIDFDGNLASNGLETFFAYGLPGDLPIVGNWNGLGAEEIGTLTPGTATLQPRFRRDLNGNRLQDDATFAFGGANQPEQVPVVGDWNGDRRTDIGTYSSTLSQWRIDLNGNLTLEGLEGPFIYGDARSTSVVGDWEGDGDDDIGTFNTFGPTNPGFGQWFIDMDGSRTLTGGDGPFRFGSVGEDRNGDGILQPTEDSNNNGILDPPDQPVVGKWEVTGAGGVVVDRYGVFRPRDASHVTALGSGGRANLGIEYFVDLGSESGGVVNLVDARTSAVVQGVPIQLFPDGRTIVIDIPLAALPESTTGVVTFGAVVGSATEITDQVPERPRSARSAASIQLEFATGQINCTAGSNGVFDDGVAFTRGFGTFTFAVPGGDALLETTAGCLPNVIKVKATDSFGNTSVLDRGVRVDQTPPQILGVTPPDNALDRNQPRQIKVQFNDDDLDPATVTTASSYLLTCITCASVDRDQTDKLSVIEYNEIDDLVVITLGLGVPSGTYTFTVIGDPGGVTDVAGNQLDGEVNPGARPGQVAAFPTGNDVPGGNFTTSLLLNFGPPRVISISGGPGTLIRTVFDLGNEDINGNGLLDGAEDNPTGDPNDNPDGSPATDCNGVLDPGEDQNGNTVLDFGEDEDHDCKLDVGNAAAPPRAIVVTFDQPLNPASINRETVFLTRTRTSDQITGLVSRIGDGEFDPFSDRVTGTTQLSNDGKTLVFTPDMKFLDPNNDGVIDGLEPDHYRFSLMGGGILQPSPEGLRENIDVSCDDFRNDDGTRVVPANVATASACSTDNRDVNDLSGYQGTTSIDLFVTNPLDARGPNNLLIIASEDRGKLYNPLDDQLSIYTSTNSGATWTKDVFFTTPESREITTPSGQFRFDVAVKPSVTFDTLGTAYVSYLLLDLPNVPDYDPNDPVTGNTFVADATGPLEITDIVGTFNAANYFFELGFQETVAPASEVGLPRRLFGRVNIDFDKNGLADRFIDLGTETLDTGISARFVSMFDATILDPVTGNPRQVSNRVPIEFLGNRVKIRLARSLADLDLDGVLDFQMVVTDPGGIVSDVAPAPTAIIPGAGVPGSPAVPNPGFAPILDLQYRTSAVVVSRAFATRAANGLVNGLDAFQPTVPVSAHIHEDTNFNLVLDPDEVDVNGNGVVDVSRFVDESPSIAADKTERLPDERRTPNSNRDFVYVSFGEAFVNPGTGELDGRAIFVARSIDATLFDTTLVAPGLPTPNPTQFPTPVTPSNRVYRFNSINTDLSTRLTAADNAASSFNSQVGTPRLATPRVATGTFGEVYVIWEDYGGEGSSDINLNRSFETFHANVISGFCDRTRDDVPFNNPTGTPNANRPADCPDTEAPGRLPPPPTVDAGIEWQGDDWFGTQIPVATTPVNGYDDPGSVGFNTFIDPKTRVPICDAPQWPDFAAGTTLQRCYSIAAQPTHGITANASIAVDRSRNPVTGEAGLFNGRIYVAYVGRRAPQDVDGHDDTDIFIAFSDDSGADWSTYAFTGGFPQLVPPGAQANDDLDRASQFNPSISVDPITGDVYLSWYDTRNDLPDFVRGRLGNQEAQLFFTVGRPETGGITFLQNQIVTTRVSNQSLNNPDRANLAYGDYSGITGSSGIAYPAWTDKRSILVDNLQTPQIERQIAEVFTARIDVQPAFELPRQTPAITDTLTEDVNSNGVLDGFEDANCNRALDAGEDLNNNGLLDYGEDLNFSCRLELGNALDGEALNVTPDVTGIPSGDGDSGGNFVAGFVISDRFIFADSAFEEDPLFLSDGMPGNPFPTLRRAIDQANSIDFSITFDRPIALPSANPAMTAFPRVFGFIDIDADQNSSSPIVDLNGDGFPDSNASLSNVNRLGRGPSGLGTDFYIDIGSELRHPGSVDLVNTATRRVVSRLLVRLEGDDPTMQPTLVVTLPRTAIQIGEFIPDFVNFSMVFGTDTNGNNTLDANEVSDKAPNEFEQPSIDHFLVADGLGDSFLAMPTLDIDHVIVDFAPSAPVVVRVRDGRTPGGQPVPYTVQPPAGGLNGTIIVGHFTDVEIEPGAVIKMRAANLDFAGAGSNIFARGDTDRPIVVTSLFNDDLSVGGDTNGDADNTTARRGDWGGIVLRTGTDDTLSFINFTRIGFGGGVVPRGAFGGLDTDVRPEAITLKAARPTIVNSIIEANGSPVAGFIDNAQAAISATPDSFADDSVLPADGTAAGQRGPLLRNLEFRDNSINGLLIHASHDTGETAFTSFTNARFDDPVPHVLTSLLRVTQGSKLTVDPGTALEPGTTSVKFRLGAIQIDGRGTFVVGGDRPNQSRVTFTSIFDDSDGVDTNDDGFANIDPTAVVPAPGDWGSIFTIEPPPRFNLAVAEAGLEQLVLGGVGPTVIIDEANIRFAGGLYVDNQIPSLGVRRQALQLETPGFYQITRNNFTNNVGPAITVFANVLRADIPFDTPATFVNEALVNEDPLFRGNTFSGQVAGGGLPAINGMDIRPIRVAESNVIGPGFADLLNTQFVDLNGDGRLSLDEGIDGDWNDTDIVHVVRGTIGLPGRVEVPNSFNFGVRAFTNAVEFRDRVLKVGGVDRLDWREIDFETDPFGAPLSNNQVFDPDLFNVSPFNLRIEPLGGTIAPQIQGPGTVQDLLFTIPVPGGCDVSLESAFRTVILGDDVIAGPTSGNNVLGGFGTDTTADAFRLVFGQDVFAFAFNVIDSDLSLAAERIEVDVRDKTGVVSTFTRPLGTGDGLITGFRGFISVFPIVEVRIFEAQNQEIPGCPFAPVFDDVGYDDFIYSTSPVYPFVPSPTQPSALLTLESLAAGTVLKSPSNQAVETLGSAEGLIVKLFDAAPVGNDVFGPDAWGDHTGLNRSDVGAGFQVGMDDGIDCQIHLHNPCQSNPTTDWGLGSAIRILGVPGNEATGQSREPVVLTSLRDDREGPGGLPSDTDSNGFIPATGSLTGVGNAPAAGDWGDIFIGARSAGDRDDLQVRDLLGNLRVDAQAIPGRSVTPDDPSTDFREDLVPPTLDETQGSVILDARIKYGAKIRVQGASQISHLANPLAFGQEAFNGAVSDDGLNADNGSLVIAHNQIFNMRDAGVVAHPGFFLAADPPHDDFVWVPAEPLIINNVIAFVDQLNGVAQAGNVGAYGLRLQGADEGEPVHCEGFVGNGDEGTSAVAMHNTIFGTIEGIRLGPDGAALAINNIISNVSANGLFIQPGPGCPVRAVAGFNLFFNNVGRTDGVNNILANPRFSSTTLFVNETIGDFRLLPFSSTEDRNNNGVLDPGEDLNQNGRLDLGGQPNPAIDSAIGEFAPGSHWAQAIDDVIVRLPLPQTVFNTSPLGPEKDLFGSVRQDDTRVPNPPSAIGVGAEVFFDMGAMESRDFGAPTVLNARIDLAATTVRLTPLAPGFVVPQIGEVPPTITVTVSEDLALGTITGRSVRLVPSGGDGVFQGNENPINALLDFNAATNVLTITPSVPLVEDRYRLTIRGTGADAITDLDGIRLDGEFPGIQTNTSAATGYQTGDGIPGGDFVSEFRIGIAPRVRAITVTDARSQPTQIIGPPRGVDADFFPEVPEIRVDIPPTSIRIDFTEPVILPDLASFTVIAFGADGQFGTTDDQPIAGRLVPAPGTVTDTVEFLPAVQGTLPTDTIWRVELLGTGAIAITDAVGILLDGEFVSGNEDNNRNGVLDPGEDRNGNGLLDDGPDPLPSGNRVSGGDFQGYFQVGDIQAGTTTSAIIVDGSFRGSTACTQGELGIAACPFNTIQEALEAAAAPDAVSTVVQVLPGTYFENVTFEVRHSGITLQSRDGDLVTIIEVAAGQRDANGILVNTALPAVSITGAIDVTVEGFQITTNGRTAVRIDLTDNATSQSPVLISRNTIFGNQTGVLALLGNGRVTRLENNIFWANSGQGIEIRGRTGDLPAEIVNNTVAFNQEGIVVRAASVGSPNIANIFNNIVVGSNGAGIRSVNTAGTTIDFNDVFANLGGPYINVIRLGTHNIAADPLFLQPRQRPATGRPNPLTADWRLGSQSPAIDAGLGDEDLDNDQALDQGEDLNGNGVRDAAPSLDHDRDARFDDPFIPFLGPQLGQGRPNFVDMGAFERQTDSSGPPGAPRGQTSASVRALDMVLAGDEVFGTEPNVEDGHRRNEYDSIDDLLDGWLKKKKLHALAESSLGR